MSSPTSLDFDDAELRAHHEHVGGPELAPDCVEPGAAVGAHRPRRRLRLATGEHGRVAFHVSPPDGGAERLARPAFLTAVTGYPMSATAGREVVALLATRDAAEEVSRPTP